MAFAALPLPAMGPLVGASFDRAVTVMAGRIPILGGVAVVAMIGGFVNFALGEFILIVFLVFWYYHSLANSVRLVSPEFRMNGTHVVHLILLGVVYGVAVSIALIFLIVPGVYIANKWSLTSVVVVKEDASVGDALARSWAITDTRFWPTLGFNILSGLGVFGVALVGYLIMVSIFAATLGANPEAIARAFTSGGVLGVLAVAGLLVYSYAIAYTYQAKDIAMLNWYIGLRSARGDP